MTRPIVATARKGNDIPIPIKRTFVPRFVVQIPRYDGVEHVPYDNNSRSDNMNISRSEYNWRAGSVNFCPFEVLVDQLCRHHNSHFVCHMKCHVFRFEYNWCDASLKCCRPFKCSPVALAVVALLGLAALGALLAGVCILAGVFGAFLAAGFPTLFLGGASVGAFSILLIAYCILRISFCVSLEN